MKQIYNKIYKAVNEGIMKGLLFDPNKDNDVSINYSYHKIDNETDLSKSFNKVLDEFKEDKQSYMNILNWFKEYNTNKTPKKSVRYYKIENVRNLQRIIKWTCEYNPEISLNWMDTSEIDNMSGLFMCDNENNNENNICGLYNGDISEWDVSNVKNMSGMFYGSSFQGDISKWNVSQVEDMSSMFKNNDHFKSDISSWETNNLLIMDNMFENCSVFIDINDWFVGNVRSMKATFKKWNFKSWNETYPEKYEKFDFKTGILSYTYLSDWDVRQVRSMERMFEECIMFNSDLSKWQPIRCKSMRGMFKQTCYFDSNINNWFAGKSKIIDMSQMFYGANAFNSPLDKWNVENVEYMDKMFQFANAFKQDISMWDTDSVISYDDMFKYNFPEEYKPVFDETNIIFNNKYIKNNKI